MATLRRNFLEAMLLSPTGKTTRIEQRHYQVIERYLSPGDRIAWQRPWGVIHTAIVLCIDEDRGRLCVYERSKDEDSKCLEVTINIITLEKQWGQLYRCDDDAEQMPLSKKLRIMLDKFGEKGYNLFGKNCQHLVAECTRHEGKESFQTKWFAVNMTIHAIKSFGKSITSEIVEAFFGGAERIGVVTVVAIQIIFFLIEFYAACERLKTGDISWKHFAELVIRHFSMAFFSCIGSALGGSLVGFLLPKVILWVVLSVFGALIADYLLDCFGTDNQYLRYLGWMAGGIVGFVCGCISPDWVIEILLACMLGFAGLFVGHTFGYSASWLFNRSGADSRIVNELSDLKTGDHITKYEWFLHPHCHAIFVKAMPNGTEMKIIKNTYRRGVIEEIVPFTERSVYRYEYQPSECHDSDQTVRNARSKLGEDHYNWFTYNCKTFAKECKCRNNDETDSRAPPQQEMDWDQQFEEMIAEPGLPEEKVEQLSRRFTKMMRKLNCFAI
ncbi:uncharacterized protein [Apostichopus japonicus]|uniref:uncharacterized protein n=1 Tax=Stichopus japonicus TaxID=307972 RepID=UPI003AB1B183